MTENNATLTAEAAAAAAAAPTVETAAAAPAAAHDVGKVDWEELTEKGKRAIGDSVNGTLRINNVIEIAVATRDCPNCSKLLHSLVSDAYKRQTAEKAGEETVRQCKNVIKVVRTTLDRFVKANPEFEYKISTSKKKNKPAEVTAKIRLLTKDELDQLETEKLDREIEAQLAKDEAAAAAAAAVEEAEQLEQARVAALGAAGLDVTLPVDPTHYAEALRALASGIKDRKAALKWLNQIMAPLGYRVQELPEVNKKAA